MPSKFLTRNNVKTTLADNITPTTTVFRIYNATPPFRNPPSPSVSSKVRLTIVDSANPSKIEIIEAENISLDGPDHRIVTVTESDPSLGRGLEQTGANSFSEGSIVFLSNTSEMIEAKLDRDDSIIVSREVITINGEDFMKVSTEEANTGKIVLFTYKIV